MQVELSKRLYSVRELYWIAYKALRTIRYLTKARRNGELSHKFVKRLMLAVTEVNGCGICSYVHAKTALEMGMSNEEIQKMLAGVMDDVPDDEVAGVMFAQHYADSRGNPTKESWQRIVDVYGTSKARGILGAVRAMMLGNVIGIPLTALFSRLRGKRDPRSSVLYEVTMLMSGAAFIPIALVHALASDLAATPLIKPVS